MHMNCFLKDKKGITITNAFQKILDESRHKPNKIGVDNQCIKCVCIQSYCGLNFPTFGLNTQPK